MEWRLIDDADLANARASCTTLDATDLGSSLCSQATLIFLDAGWKNCCKMDGLVHKHTCMNLVIRVLDGVGRRRGKSGRSVIVMERVGLLGRCA